MRCSAFRKEPFTLLVKCKTKVKVRYESLLSKLTAKIDFCKSNKNKMILHSIIPGSKGSQNMNKISRMKKEVVPADTLKIDFWQEAIEKKNETPLDGR